MSKPKDIAGTSAEPGNAKSKPEVVMEQTKEQKETTKSPARVVTFFLYSPDEVSGVGIRTDVEELGGWDTTLFIMEKKGPHIWIGTLTLPEGVAKRQNNVVALYKYCIEESNGSMTWEHGDNRPLKDQEEQAFDVWRKPPYTHYPPAVYHTNTTSSFNNASKWAGSSWGSSTTKIVKGVYKCFADYLFLIMREKIATCGPEDDAVFTPTVEFMWSYYTMFNCLLACEETNVSISNVEDYAKEVTRNLKDNLTPQLALCLCFIEGSSSDAKHIIVWDWGGLEGWATVGNTWTGYTYHANPYTKRFLKVLGSDIFWGGAMIIQLEYRLMPWMWNGLRSVMREANRQGVYVWLRLVPLLECLLSGHQGYSVPNLEPNIMGRGDADALFKSELAKIVNKYDLLFLQPSYTGTQLPILRALIRNAPAMHSLLEIMSCHDSIVMVPAYYAIFLEQVERRLRNYEWSYVQSEQKTEVANLIKLLKKFSPNVVSSCTTATLDCEYFAFVDSMKAVDIIIYCVNASKDCKDDLLSPVGIALEKWLVRMYTSKDKNRKRTVRSDLAILIDTFQQLITLPALKCFRERITKALRSLLQLYQDSVIIVDELAPVPIHTLDPAVYTVLEERLKQAVSSFVISVDGQLEWLSALHKIQHSLTPDGVHLRNILLDTLIRSMCSGADAADLSLLVKFERTWISMFRSFRKKYSLSVGQPPADPSLHPVWIYLAYAANLLSTLVDDINAGSCRLGDLQVVLDNEDSTNNLLDACDLPMIQASLLAERKQQITRFNEVVTQMQCLVNIFCSPLRVDCGDLPKTLIEIRTNWDLLVLGAVKDQFASHPVLPHLEWLYTHRGSELFLMTWKRIGATTPPPRPTPVIAPEPASAGSTPESTTVFRPPPIPPPLPTFNRRIPIRVHAEPSLLSLLNRANADDETEVETSKSSLKLEDDVVRWVIGRMAETWTEFFEQIDTKAMLFPRLTLFFGPVHRRQIPQEMELLVLTNKFGYSKEWIIVHLELVLDYKLLEEHRKRLSSLLGLLDLLAPLFSVDFSKDELHQSLRVCHERLEREWDTQNLANTTIFVKPVKAIFESFSDLHLCYLDEMCRSHDLLQWLISNKSTDAFNRLLSICKSNTDDPIVLSAIASLSSTRNLLSDILYPYPPFSSLEHFLQEFVKIGVQTDAVITQLKTASDQLPLLKKTFDEKTCSPGMQAINTLKDILNSGQYIWSTNKGSGDTITTSLMLQYSSSSKKIGLALDELLDLRNRLMLVEVPKSQDTGESLTETINIFVDQLKIVQEIGRLLDQLHLAMHFDFQDHNETFSSQTPLPILQNRAEQLAATLAEWRDIIKESRNENYFLNYFSMSQIHHLILLLNEDPQASTTTPPITTLPNTTTSTTSNSQAPQIKSTAAQIHNMLLYVCTELTIKETENAISKWLALSNAAPSSAFSAPTLSSSPSKVSLVPLPKSKPMQLLSSIGKFLEGIFKNKRPVSRIVSKDVIGKGSRYLFDEGSHGCYVTVAKQEQVLDLILTMFVQKGRIPEPDEILLCSPLTTYEELQLISARWANAIAHGRADRLYVVANTHLLSYTLQSQAVALVSTVHARDCTTLVFVSGAEEGQHMVSALSSRKLQITVLDDGTLRDLYKNIVNKYTSSTVVFTSHMAGWGKTNSIYKTVATREVAYRHIPINGSLTANQLIQLFDSYKLSAPVAFHIDIGPTATVELNSLMFQIVVVGMIHDSFSGSVYHRAQKDSFYIEVPNSFRDLTRERMYFFTMLPQQQTDFDKTEFDLFKYEARVDEGERITYHAVLNYELQFVVKYLQAFDDDTFQNFSADTPDFHPDAEPDLDAEQCFDVLQQHCTPEENAQGPSSFILFSNFVKFLYYQFVQVTYYDLLSNSLVADAMGTPSFKHFVINFLISTSHDYATRSVPLAEGNNNNNEQRNNNDDDGVIMEYAEIFKSMKLWHESDHPFVFFNQGNTGIMTDEIFPGGLSILSLNPRTTEDFMDDELKQTLVLNGFSFTRDWSKLTTVEALQILGSILGVPAEYGEFDNTFVITIDTLMKMLAIQLRVRYGIPVIIMGETGCGKTALIKYMCGFLQVPLHILNVHGGIISDDIVTWMATPIAQAQASRSQEVYVFFDEINTCNCMSLFKNILCDGFMEGKKLPQNIKFIAAANPYRVKNEGGASKQRYESGLSYERHHVLAAMELKTHKDVMHRLTYRVHTLPNSLLDYVWDYGYLRPEIERLYVTAMLKKELSYEDDQYWRSFTTKFTELICGSHRYLRELEGENGTVSLRDVSRCAKLFNFFHGSLARRASYGLSLNDGQLAKYAAVLSIAHCYHSRLASEQRADYRRTITNLFNQLPPFDMTLARNEFSTILNNELQFYISQISPGEGIALNEALCENIFMILVCILNKIPIFVVGKPGSSKSLAMELLTSNLNGKASESPFFRDLPAIEVFSYQCSPLSDSQGIEQTFQHAIRYQANTANTLVVVLLDEVGLAEQSLNLPLKVLHKLLEKPEVAVVGISNWTLDLAKMNRAVRLTRAEPSIDDLKLTAMGIVSNQHLEGSLRSLAEAYYNVYRDQSKRDFFGLRDFYHLIKYLHRELHQVITHELLTLAVLRNFGGRPAEMPLILREFFLRVGINYRTEEAIKLIERQLVSSTSSSSLVNRSTKLIPVIEIIRCNIADRNARHLMVLTHNDAALQILLDDTYNVMVQEGVQKPLVIFGSDFPDDRSDLHIFMNIQRIKSCMADGRPVILIHSDNLYESLYDLLNQHYTSYNGQRFVRLALGTHSRLCPVHYQFRVVVVVDVRHAYQNLPPPLLNRFEKQVLTRHDLLSLSQKAFLERLKKWVSQFANPTTEGKKVTQYINVADVFVGYNDDTLSSLVLTLARTPTLATSQTPEQEDDEEIVFDEAVSRLMWIATPESVIRGGTTTDWTKMYFEQQVHSSLPDILAHVAFVEDQEAVGAEAQGVSKGEGAAEKVRQLKAELEGMGLDKEKLATEMERIDKEWEKVLAEIAKSEQEAKAKKRMYWPDDEADLGTQLMVITYSPVSDDVGKVVRACNKNLSLSLLKLHEFSSSTELTSHVQAFFSNEHVGHDEAILVIQCDPVASSSQRIKHAKYIIEQERASYVHRMKQHQQKQQEIEKDKKQEPPATSPVEEKGKQPEHIQLQLQPKRVAKYRHVMVLVHLSRGYSSASFAFDYERNWFAAFLDDIKPDSMLLRYIPKTTELLRGTEMELLQKIQLKHALRDSFRSCLARLIYPYQRTSQGIQLQIEMIIKLLDDPEFLPVLEKQLFYLMETTINARQKDEAQSWQEAVAMNNQQISAYNTFREALFQRLSNTISGAFTLMLCHADRNSNVTAYFKSTSPTTKKLWLMLLQDPQICYWDVIGSTFNVEDARTRYDILSDGNGHCFEAEFPFSFIFFHSIETIRPEAEKLGRVEDSTQRLFKTVFPSLPVDLIAPQQLDAYLNDFIHMRGCISSVDRKQYLDIHSNILKKEMGSFNSISQVHTAFWKNEKRLQTMFAILDNFGVEVSDKFSQAMKKLKEPTFTLSDLDVYLLDLVLVHLTPTEASWSSWQKIYAWIYLTAQVSTSIQALLKLQRENAKDGATPDAIADLDRKHKCIMLIRIMMRDAASLLDIQPRYCYVFATNTLAHCDYRKKLPFNTALNQAQALLNYCKDRSLGQVKLGMVMENFVAHYVLYDSAAILNMEPELLHDLISIAADQNPVFGTLLATKKTPKPMYSLETSAALRRYILRAVLKCSDPKILESCRIKLLEQISQVPLDHPACTLICECVEDSLWDAKADPIQVVSGIKTLDVEKLPKLHRIEHTSQLRYFIAHLTDELIRAYESNTPISNAYLTQVNHLLGPKGFTASRLYFLKYLARTKGLAYAQELIGSSAIQGQLKWIPEWLNDVKLKRFMRRRHILNVDPFLMEKAYTSVREAVRSAVEGDVKPLVSLTALHKAQARFKKHMLLSVFQECYLLYTREGVTPREGKAFLDWLGSIPFPLSTPELHLFMAFARNTFITTAPVAPSASTTPTPTPTSTPTVPVVPTIAPPETEVNANAATASKSNITQLPRDPFNFFKLSKKSTPEQVALLSAIAHMCALASAHNNEHPLFYKMLYAPADLAAVFIPALPDDDMQMFMAVLGGGWYECPNGHTYHVDQCGKPMEKLNCPTCGAVIGGIDHELDPSNKKKANTQDQTMPGYVLGPHQPNSESSFGSERNLSPVAFRILRIFLHSLLLVGSVTNLNTRSDIVRLIQKGTARNLVATSVPQFLLDHLLADFEHLSNLLAIPAEDIALALNILCATLGESSTGVDPMTKLARGAWETKFKDTHISPLFDALGDRLKLYYSSHDHDDGVVGDIREISDPAKMAAAQRNVLQPLLWRYRTPIPMALDHLKSYFLANPANSGQHPVLHLFLTQEEQLRSLRYLRAVLEWQKMLSLRFDKRIDRETARTQTVGEMLESLPVGERKKWNDAFEGYKEGWNGAWKYVDRFVCMEIPPIFRHLVMDEKINLCFSLPDERDEGICPLSLVRFLVDKHNQFLQQVHQILRQRAASDKLLESIVALGEEQPHIPTHLLTDSHLIVYSGSQQDLVPFLQTQIFQSLQNGKGTEVKFNFERIEQYLIDTTLIGKPLIDLEIRKFDYANESRMSGALQALRQKIPQLELTADVKNIILKDLGGVGHFRRCSHVLEICVGFLAATGGLHVKLPGEMWLAEYVRDTLVMGDCDEVCGPNSAVAKHVQLQHLVSLWTLLDEKLNVDPFKDISHKYKKPLTEQITHQLIGVMSHLQLAVLLPVLKEFVLNYLNEASANLAESLSLKEALSYIEVNAEAGVVQGHTVPLADIDWFTHAFPSDIELRHALEVFKFLSSATSSSSSSSTSPSVDM